MEAIVSRKLWFLNRDKPTQRVYPPVSGASVDDDAEDVDEDDGDGDDGDGDDPKPAKPTYTPEQQQHIDRLVGEAKRKAKADAEAEFQRKLEEDRLATEGKYKELYENLKSEADSLKPQVEALTEQVAGLEAAVRKYIDPQIDQLPKLTQNLIRRQPVLEQLELLAESADELGSEPAQRPRVPPSKTGRRERKNQPLAAAAVFSRQSRVIKGLKERAES